MANQIAPPQSALGKSLDSLARRLGGGEQLMIGQKDSEPVTKGFKLPAFFKR